MLEQARKQGIDPSQIVTNDSEHTSGHRGGIARLFGEDPSRMQPPADMKSTIPGQKMLAPPPAAHIAESTMQHQATAAAVAAPAEHEAMLMGPQQMDPGAMGQQQAMMMQAQQQQAMMMGAAPQMQQMGAYHPQMQYPGMGMAPGMGAPGMMYPGQGMVPGMMPVQGGGGAYQYGGANAPFFFSPTVMAPQYQYQPGM
jgi:hypothetical protein